MNNSTSKEDKRIADLFIKGFKEGLKGTKTKDKDGFNAIQKENEEEIHDDD